MALPNLAASQRSIRLPNDIKERALRWVQTQAASAHRSPTDAPFRRLIDFWFAAISWALHHSIEPVAKAQGEKFVSIGPTPQDVRLQEWKVELLVLLALRDFGREHANAQDPVAIVDLANRYAEAGAEPLVRALESAAEFAVPMLYRVTDVLSDKFASATKNRTTVY